MQLHGIYGILATQIYGSDRSGTIYGRVPSFFNISHERRFEDISLSWSRPFPGAAVQAPRALRAYSPWAAADYHMVACDTLEAAFAIPRPSSYAVLSA